MAICNVDGCERSARTRGLCDKHYRRLLHHGDVNFLAHKPTSRQCRASGCKNMVGAKGGDGFCWHHWYLNKTYGTPYVAPKKIRNNKSLDHPEEWSAYEHMKHRCYTKSDSRYEHYGGRGIKVCDRWLGPRGFDNFYEDMGDKPSYARGSGGRAIYSLDRIDVNGDYCPENCRWADTYTQAANRRKNNLGRKRL